MRGSHCGNLLCDALLHCALGGSCKHQLIKKCARQGPTYVNWTEPIGSHPEMYHAFDADVLRRMRQSSIFATVICDWQYALAQAEHSGRFVDVGAPSYQDTCTVPLSEHGPLASEAFLLDVPAQQMVHAKIRRAWRAESPAMLPDWHSCCFMWHCL